MLPSELMLAIEMERGELMTLPSTPPLALCLAPSMLHLWCFLPSCRSTRFTDLKQIPVPKT
ncbi:hypothetical protein L798_09426 [Zootermopsis nevadensis]|uniref:Uncharacterized protein n=1 Tax=Zootermopsis nevadensis TaxID=136037 RepID=A0A067RAH8_ZOONE|nr:hypothetical protein L798_09426 [Zootermopsis nevadensis]